MSGLKITIDFDAAILRQLEDIPRLLKYKVIDRCAADFARPIVARARELAPSSKKTGSRGNGGSKWGRRAARKFSGRASMLQHDSGDHIGSRVYRGERATIIYVGAKYPRGNKQQFNNSVKGRKVVYWGKTPQEGKAFRPLPRPTFLEQAYTETQSAAYAAFRAQLAKQIKELGLG